MFCEACKDMRKAVGSRSSVADTENALPQGQIMGNLNYISISVSDNIHISVSVCLNHVHNLTHSTLFQLNTDSDHTIHTAEVIDG